MEDSVQEQYIADLPIGAATISPLPCFAWAGFKQFKHDCGHMPTSALKQHHRGLSFYLQQRRGNRSTLN